MPNLVLELILLIFCIQFISGSIFIYYLNAYKIKRKSLHILSYCMLIVSIAIAPYTSSKIRDYIESPQLRLETIEAITGKNSTNSTLDDWIGYKSIINADGEIIDYHFTHISESENN